MPSASRPSLTHFTILAMRQLYALDEDLRPAPPVVERLAARGQLVHRRRLEALLEKPVRGAGGECEYPADAQGAGALLARLEQVLSVARVPVALRHREARELGAPCLLEG